MEALLKKVVYYRFHHVVAVVNLRFFIWLEDSRSIRATEVEPEIRGILVIRSIRLVKYFLISVIPCLVRRICIIAIVDLHLAAYDCLGAGDSALMENRHSVRITQPLNCNCFAKCSTAQFIAKIRGKVIAGLYHHIVENVGSMDDTSGSLQVFCIPIWRPQHFLALACGIIGYGLEHIDLPITGDRSAGGVCIYRVRGLSE